MSGQARREARRKRAHAEFAAYPAPPTPGLWPCPRDPGVFRLHDGVGWTDWTQKPAKQPERCGGRPSPGKQPEGSRSGPTPPKRAEGDPQPTPGPLASGRGSAVRQSRTDRAELLQYASDDELRGVPEASVYDFEPDRLGRGWWPDPAAPDIGQRRFHTGTDWSDLIAIENWRLGRASYYRSTLEESRRRNELWLEELSHDPSVTLGPATSVSVVLLTTLASCLLIASPALPPGTASDLAHSIGVVLGLGLLFLFCIVAVNTMRELPVEWRSTPLWVSYALAIPAFVVLRGFRSVLSALGFR